MAYVEYSGLTSPNEVLEKIAEYVISKGYTIDKQYADDLNIYDMSFSDGKKFAFKNRTEDYTIVLRTANGTNIFGSRIDSVMDVTPLDQDQNYYGIGMTVGESYSDTGRWYNQYNVPINHNGNDVLGVFIPVPNDGRTYTLWCNEVTSPNYSLVFTVIPENSIDRPVAHLIYADIDKYEEWDGGAFFSGTATRYQIGQAYKVFTDSYPVWKSNTLYDIDDIAIFEGTAYKCIQQHTSHYDRTEDTAYWQQTTVPASSTYDSITNVFPVISSGQQSNSFLRINIDEAPSDLRGNILWACSGTDNITGKPMSLPVRTGDYMNGDIPHYRYFQSQSRLDWGRNITTLNCITLNLPIFVSVQVDPDVLKNYAATGVIPGIYYVSMLDMQTGYTYEMNYPMSGMHCQAFALTRRRGTYGFDGMSVLQESSD